MGAAAHILARNERTGASDGHAGLWNNLHVAVRYAPELESYPGVDQIPFDPDEQYPEYQGQVSTRPNAVYRAVRQALRLMNRDEENYSRSRWNPLRGVVEPGMKVVVKPNWVRDRVPVGCDLDGLLTHACVIRPVLDYVQAALRGEGQIILGDAPIQGADWDNLLRITGIAETVQQVNARASTPVELVDFRSERTVRDWMDMVLRREVVAVPCREVDLGPDSTLAPLMGDYRKFRVTQYPPHMLSHYHNPRRNAYVIHHALLDADVLVNLPKFKVHKKAGLTCACKNLVGTITRKDCLPHHRIGDYDHSGADGYRYHSILSKAHSLLCDALETGSAWKRRACCILAKCVNRAIRFRHPHFSDEGDWFGNDTTWRMVHDLNLALCYADREGRMTDQVQRRTLHIVDAIVGGEGECPLEPIRHPCGTIIVGTNPLAVDLVAATLMGFDLDRVPLLRDAWRPLARWTLPPHEGSREGVCVTLQEKGIANDMDLDNLGKRLNFHLEPPAGWRGMIERQGALDAD